MRTSTESHPNTSHTPNNNKTHHAFKEPASQNSEQPNLLNDPIVSELYEKEHGFTNLIREYRSLKDINPKLAREYRNEIESILVDGIVCDFLKEELVSDLEEFGVDEDTISTLERELNKFTLKEKKQILSYPKEVRERVFRKYEQLIDEYPVDFLQKLLELAQRYSATIGYHLSDADINPDTNGKWTIQGYELDDRDDRPMAYYSLDWYNRYRKKPSKYLYLVRAFLNEDMGHKLDSSNNWGRASSLSVISKVNLEELERIKEEKLRKIFKE